MIIYERRELERLYEQDDGPQRLAAIYAIAVGTAARDEMSWLDQIEAILAKASPDSRGDDDSFCIS